MLYRFGQWNDIFQYRSIPVYRFGFTAILYNNCGRNESIPNKELSSSEMALSLNPQDFAQSYVGRDASYPCLINT